MATEGCGNGASVAGAAAAWPLSGVTRCLYMVFKEEKWLGTISQRFVLLFGPQAGRCDEAGLSSGQEPQGKHTPTNLMVFFSGAVDWSEVFHASCQLIAGWCSLPLAVPEHTGLGR